MSLLIFMAQSLVFLSTLLHVIPGQRIFPVDRPLIKNNPKSVISVMMIIVLFLHRCFAALRAQWG